jgi:hypothetical protein
MNYPVNGCGVVYTARPKEKGYLTAPHWTERAHREPFVLATLRRIHSSG